MAKMAKMAKIIDDLKKTLLRHFYVAMRYTPTTENNEQLIIGYTGKKPVIGETIVVYYFLYKEKAYVIRKRIEVIDCYCIEGEGTIWKVLSTENNFVLKVC